MELDSLGRQSIYEKENSDTKPTGLQVWGLGARLTTQAWKKQTCYRNAKNPEKKLAPEESPPVEPMKQAGESLREASAQTTLLTAKSKTRILGPGTSEPYMRQGNLHK